MSSKFHIMKRLILLYIAFLIFTVSFAQQRTHIPYSIYGLGKINPRGGARNIAMGRTGLALSSPFYLNNQNPASYSSIDSVSFFFDFSLGGDFVKYQTGRNGTQHGTDMNLKTVALGFRINPKWTSSIGIHPYSTVGYRIEAIEDIDGAVNETFSVQINGNGGLTQFYWDHAYELFKGLSLGVSMNYLFGKIESKEQVTSAQLSDNIYVYQDSYLHRFYADFGVQYHLPAKKNFEVTLGGVFGKNHKIRIKNEYSVTESSGIVYEQDVTKRGYFDFPLYAGFGAAVNYKNALTLTADYLYYNWSKTESETSDFQYKSNNLFRFGLEYIPGRYADLGYFGGVAYRLGGYIEQSYLEISSKRISDKGFSAGFGFPMLQNKTTLNVAYNFGVNGTLEHGLIKETYHSVMLSLTLHDWWFIKRKID
jgi:hypothetical protein